MQLVCLHIYMYKSLPVWQQLQIKRISYYYVENGFVEVHELKVKYHLLSLLSSSQIIRVVIGNEGVPYCVGEWSSNLVEHIDVDPVHG